MFLISVYSFFFSLNQPLRLPWFWAKPNASQQPVRTTDGRTAAPDPDESNADILINGFHPDVNATDHPSCSPSANVWIRTHHAHRFYSLQQPILVSSAPTRLSNLMHIHMYMYVCACMYTYIHMHMYAYISEDKQCSVGAHHWWGGYHIGNRLGMFRKVTKLMNRTQDDTLSSVLFVWSMLGVGCAQDCSEEGLTWMPVVRPGGGMIVPPAAASSSGSAHL